MVKKIVIGTLIALLMGAVGVGIYDAYQGNSSLRLSDVNLLQSNSGNWGQGQGQGRGQGQGQGPNQERGQGQRQQGQNQGQGWGQGNQSMPGNGSGVPQAADHEWITLSGTVISVDQRGITVDTADMGQLSLEMGPPWFASQQEVIFNPGDTVTILGFAGQGNMFQAGEITNDTTGTTLHLRDPNGRPLWAGRGRGQASH